MTDEEDSEDNGRTAAMRADTRQRRRRVCIRDTRYSMAAPLRARVPCMSHLLSAAASRQLATVRNALLAVTIELSSRVDSFMERPRLTFATVVATITTDRRHHRLSQRQ